MRLMLPLFATLLIVSACSKNKEETNTPGGGTATENPLPVVTGEASFSLSGTDHYVNVMGNSMPQLPSFDALTKQAGKLRGYVKDLSGKPLAGAFIGIRSSAVGGYYSSASKETDAKGYNEIEIPY